MPTATAPTTMPIPKVPHEAPVNRADLAVESTTAFGDAEDAEIGADVNAIAAQTFAGRGILT